MQFVCPEDLKNISGLLVVIHVLNDQEIRKQLSSLGVKNVIHILELYKIVEQKFEINQNEIYFLK